MVKKHKLSPEAQAILDRHNAEFEQVQKLVVKALPTIMGCHRQ